MKKYFPSSELIINEDGSVFHLHVKPEWLADKVILVGDPGRVALVASHFENKECEVESREFKTITGTYKGKRITVVSTGIGCDNIDIVMNELDALANIDFETREEKEQFRQLELVRIGTCGGLQPNTPVGTFVCSQKSIGNALQDSHRIVNLIDGLLNLAKADYQSEQITMEEVRLDELLLDARELVLKAHPDYHIELVFEQEAEEDNVLTVIGNSYLLTTAFVNLVENNCKYSSNRTSSVLIAYWEQWAIIRLSDTGVGMSDTDKENLFTLFYRGENKNIAPGNGIGMALTQKIIHLHKGELTVSSHKDEGTTFVVKLPHI